MRPRLPVGARVNPPLEAFQRLVEHAPDVIVRVGLLPRPRLEYINPAVQKLSGYSPEDWYRDPGLAARIIHPSDRATLLGVARTMRLPPQPFSLRWIAADGREVRTEIRATGVRGTDGSLKAIEAIARDVTTRGEDASVLATGAGDQPHILYCGIELDPDRLEVTWNQRTVRLTLKEVLLLKYLIRHCGEMLSRDRLLHDVWGYEFSGRSRTLDVHVCRLRRKLPPLASSLLTIDHVGYSLAKAEG
ncbi:MAG: winged helix-turn-helix domain-containing protein [Bacteroidales bacterium]